MSSLTRRHYNGLRAVLDADLTSSGTTITFAAALTHSAGTNVPTISGNDFIPLEILDSSGHLSEVVWLTAYTAAATTGTITRGQEGTTGVAHLTGDKVVQSPTAADVEDVDTWHLVGSGGGEPGFEHSWVNWSSIGTDFPYVQFIKHANGDVEVKGAAKSGSGLGAVIFTLPAGYRPEANRSFAVVAYNGSSYIYGMIQVGSDGGCNPVIGSTALMNFDGVRFRAVG